MAVFELVIFLLFAGALLAAVARRTHVPYPALLALAGATLALLPGTPSVTLDPELALALFVAPVLLDAAFDSSPRDLKQNWREKLGKHYNMKQKNLLGKVLQQEVRMKIVS